MLLDKHSAGGRWHVRPDGPDKVTGRLTYLTDMQLPDMLYGKILRSSHAHAWIITIDTKRALQLPGVYAVITHKDVPGMNRFGIAFPDQPVLCEDRVRYIGDAVAAVAAESEELAEYALSLIEVVYEPLPVIDSPEAGLLEGAPKLHPDGNVLHRTEYKRGDCNNAFTECAYVTENTYVTPRQMHAYMETEGGLFVPEANGCLTVYAPTQHGFKDQMQLARILAIPEADIRVVSSPIGGSFGGKDELNIQSYGALLALKSGRPVKIHHSRFESVRTGLKRHPMKVSMKTGIDADGLLIAHEVRIIADTGAYATLGAPVLNFATEHTQGPYLIPNVSLEGVSVYTNNGVSGEFRGFGGNQVIFALEGQLDRLAEAIGIDPWELRHRNLRAADSPGPFGQKIVPTEGARQVWESVAGSKLMSGREQLAIRTDLPWIRRGVGAAIAMHGSGLGFGLPDPAGGRLKLNELGKIEASFGYEEFGQGLLAALQIMLTERFGCHKDDLELVIGDTARVPHSGSTTASRATSMMWQSLARMGPQFSRRLLEEASLMTDRSADALSTGPGGVYANSGELLISYLELSERVSTPIECETEFQFPTTPDEIFGAHYLHTYTALAIEVEVNLLTGRVKVTDQYHAVAAGPVINPMGFVGQVEGASSMALGFTLTEDAIMEDGLYKTNNFDSYLIPTIKDTPKGFQLDAIDELPEGDVFGPRGVGEIGTVAVAPAIAAAVYQAVGKWIQQLPIKPEDLLSDQPAAWGREWDHETAAT
ncbi:xanthine dehydrogenase subunit D [Paenibacillus sp. FSL H7-0331]|uniref:xanthine dehydrogenase subunit D n=1 Tax=Paenibacillus sp. FSL H7-0331 TaxID=1920421 RepID=UPI00096DE2C3|nr:xanthine dehydrogenase subunit D [Paenibacillus sp. FSL H7-0331]OMF18251.1 xanthine dehydrogenase subunit D [Paenibacillus sp. FSL H7-0331]